MKRQNWWKDAFRNIGKRFVSWLSIVSIVFIGITVILGLFFMHNSMDSFFNKYIEEHNFKDLDVVCSIGVKESDVERIKNLESVYQAEGQVALSSEMSSNSGSTGVTLMSVTETVSVPYALEGELPSTIYECAVCPEVADELKVTIGDEVEAAITSARFSNVLKNNRFKITGIVADPDIIVKDQTCFCVMILDTFDTSSYSFDYTNVLVDVGDPGNLSVMSKEYDARVEAVKEEIEGIFDEMTKTRLVSLSQDLDEEYNNASTLVEEELKKGRDKIEEGQKEFDEKIGEAKKNLDDGQAQLNEAKSKAEKEFSAAEKKIKDGEAEYNRGIADGERQLSDAETVMEKELEYARFLLFDGMLQIDKNEKLLNEKEAEYKAGEERLARAKEQLDKGKREYNEGINELDDKISVQLIQDVIDLIEPHEGEDPIVDKVLDWLRAAVSLSPIERAEELLRLYDDFFDLIPLSDEEKHEIDELLEVDKFREAVQSLKDGKAAIEEGQRQYDSGLEELEEGRKLLDQGWYSLEQAKKELAEAQAQYNAKEPEARKKLADAKAEFEQKKADGAKELEDAKRSFASKKKEAMDEIKKYDDELSAAKDEFDAEKEKGEKKIADAWQKYWEERKTAMDKLAEARQQIEDARAMPCTWLVQTRNANYGYLLLKSAVQSIQSISYVFTPMFAAIIAIVCYFTMVIVTGEQTRQIGMCKAFGMYDSEIRNKYIVYGATAAVTGSVLGVIGAFQLERIVLLFQASVYVFDEIPHKAIITPVIVAPVAVILLTCAAVYFSCRKFLRCSAVGLINGNEPEKRSRKNSSKHDFGNVYLRLVMNNFVTDLGREIVSVAIITSCILLIGISMSIKLGFTKALEKQADGVLKFDVKMTTSESVTDEEREKIEEIIKDQDYICLPSFGSVMEAGNKQITGEIICIDDMDAFREFYTVDNSDGEQVELTDDAILVTQEMSEKNSMEKGAEVLLVNNDMKVAATAVGDNFAQHAGKTALISRKYYEELFGSIPANNTYYIKVTDGQVSELTDELFQQKGVSDVSLPGTLLETNKPTIDLFSILVLILMVFSFILSFMILLNLSSILVSHRMKELLTMRVNGFSKSQVVGYLAREVIVTLVIAVVIALITGFAGIMKVMIAVETDGFMYIRHPEVVPWIVAVLVNLAFSFALNSIAFRKVNKVPLTDLSKYM
jgi:putative ABC transport system permease protein